MARYEAVLDIPADTSGGMSGIKAEDGGQALICYAPETVSEGGDGCFFVRLHSWDERDPDDREHRLFREFMGQRVRVTVEPVGVMRKIRTVAAVNTAGDEEAALGRLRALLIEAGVAEKDVIGVTVSTNQYGTTAQATFWS